MPKAKIYSIPVIKGDLVIETYDKGKLVSKEKRKEQIFNEEHWRGWQKADKNYGSARLKSNFDYGVGRRVIDTYSISNGDHKVVYKRDYSKQARVTSDRKEYPTYR